MGNNSEAYAATDNVTAASLVGYIAQMAGELAILAERSELTMLAYFLNLARVEAELKSNELTPPEEGESRRSSPPRSTRRD